jgi:hypothetical protein
MSSQNVAYTYSPTEPESGTFAVARKLPLDDREDDSRSGGEMAREALYTALVVLANAAARLERGSR